MSDEKGITFAATFYKATTLVDGGLRISLDLPAHEAKVLVELMKIKKRVLEVAIVPHPEQDVESHKYGF